MITRGLWGATGLVAVVYVTMVVWALSSGYGDGAGILWMLVLVPGFVGAGVVLLWRRPENRTGHLLLVGALAMFALPTILEIPTVVVFERSGAQPWMWAAMWLNITLNSVAAVLLSTLIVLLPDGRFRHRRERRLLLPAWGIVVLPALSLVSNDQLVTHSQAFVGVEDIASPLVFPALAPLGDFFSGLVSASYLIFIAAVVMQVMRYRRATVRERKQVRWVLYAGYLAVVAGSVPFLLESFGLIDPLGHTFGAALVTIVPFMAFPASVVVAVMEPAWVDVDIVIRKSFVYGALSFVILLLYVAVAASFGVAAGARVDVEVAVVLTVVVAVLFQPARRRLQAIADRWVFGARPTRYEAVAQLGEAIEESPGAEELLPGLVSTIARAVDVAWVHAALDDGTHAAVGMVEGEPTLSLPVGVGDEQVGVVRMAAGRAGAIPDDDVRLVQTLVAQTALAVMNARLAGRIVNAAEAERRRIERNIHDGAQQELVALVARLGMARAAAADGAVGAAEIEELQREAQRILFDLRELAQGIHPSVLSDGGVLEAVEDRCARLPLDVSLRYTDGLRTERFDDEVEGAAYFFITESLANVLKHAGASRADVSLTRENGDIRLAVSDDGCGFDGTAVNRDGLDGLSDRIRALGGTMQVSSHPGRGTSVVATIPVA